LDNNPSVCVIAVSHNHGKLLPKALDSILSQTYDNFGIILIDDCSTDGSQDVIESYLDNPAFDDKLIAYHKLDPNAGHIQTFYYITEYYKQHYEYDLVTILETDDSWKPDSLEKRVKALVENDWDAVHTDVDHRFDDTNMTINDFWKTYSYPIESPLSIPFLMRDNRVFTCTLLSKHDYFVKAYDYSLFHNLGVSLCDYAAVLRMVKLGAKIGYIEESLSVYNKVATSVTNSMGQEKLLQETFNTKQLASNGKLFEDFNEESSSIPGV
jgi:glycosyltransferase involved in cell wall biosynthesis